VDGGVARAPPRRGVAIAGESNDGLVGVDLVRATGPVVWHVEASASRTGELARSAARGHARAVAGGLWSVGETSVAFEYFWNGDGYSGTEFRAYRSRLDGAWSVASNPASNETQRRAAATLYALEAGVPFGRHLGLRRHYGSVVVSRREVVPSLTVSVRALAGLSDRGVVLVPALAYSPGRSVSLNLDVVTLMGPDDSEYRMAPVRVIVQARARYAF
jgi:hypothetical protein